MGIEGIRLAEDIFDESGAEGECGEGEGELLAILEAVAAAREEEEEEEKEELVDDNVDGFCGIGGAAFLEIEWSVEVFGSMGFRCCCCCCCCFWCMLISVELLCKGVMEGCVGDGVLRTEFFLTTAAAALLRAGGTDGFSLVPGASPVAIFADTGEDAFPSI